MPEIPEERPQTAGPPARESAAYESVSRYLDSLAKHPTFGEDETSVDPDSLFVAGMIKNINTNDAKYALKTSKKRRKRRKRGILSLPGLKITPVDSTSTAKTAEHYRALKSVEGIYEQYKPLVKSLEDYDHGIAKAFRRTMQEARGKLRFRSTAFSYRVEYMGDSIRVELTRGMRGRKQALENIKYLVKTVRHSAREPNVIWKNHPVFGEWGMTGGVRTKANFFSNASVGLKRRRVVSKKKPTTDDNYVGVELEFYSPLRSRDIEDKIGECGLEYTCQVVRDGSLDNERGTNCPNCSACSIDCEDCCTHCDECADFFTSGNTDPKIGHELRILSTEAEIGSVIERASAMIRGFGGSIDTSCGMHVHMDVRHRDKSASYTALASAQTALLGVVPQSRRDNTYCMVNKVAELAKAGGGRYNAINHESISQHGSIEVRLHGGTLDATKINNWIELLKALIDTPTELKDSSEWADGMLELSDRYDLPHNLTNYYLQRELEFAA